MKNLQGLLAFVEAADCGSLTRAAERLDVSPAAISKNLARLEQQLGVRLMARSTRRLALTAEGAMFLERARAALLGLDQAVAEVSQSAQEPAGRVRLSVGVAFGRRWVLPLLPALAQRWTRLQIEVDLDNRPTDLAAGGFDIGIRGGRIEDSNIVARRICALPMVLLASPAYLRQAGVPDGADSLAGHRCAAVRFGNGSIAPWHFGKGARRRSLMPQAQLFTSDPESVLELALAGGGIVQSALLHALPYLRSGRLKLVLPGVLDQGEREIVLHYPHRQYLAPRVRVVVDELLKRLAEPGDLHLTVEDAMRLMPHAVAGA